VSRFFSKNIPDFYKPGEYRDVNVYLTKSKYPLPDYTELPERMKDFIRWADKKREKYHPIEFAADAHRHFIYIHPFFDGNGRVSRLIMNTLLLQDKYLPVSIPIQHRKEYIDLLERGRKFPRPFNAFIAELVLTGTQLP
jgi:Fic family protein